MYIHISDITDQNVRMILPPSADGEAPTVFTYTVDGLSAPGGMAFDSTHIHIGDFSDNNVRMILPPSADDEAPTVFTYTVAGLANPQSIAFDGTYIHLGDVSDDNVRMILPPSADGEAPTVFTYTVDGLGAPTGITYDGTHIHLGDVTDDNVRMILPPSAGGEAPVVFTYTVPGVDSLEGMTFDGTYIHISDRIDDNFRMILPPSSNGQASTVFTYTVDGISDSRGMTFDGSIQPQATLTLSTTDTDIREGEAVDISIASDIDISDFTASDITVTGGTRGALTENSATSYTLRVTAGSAGTLTVSIAEDAVTPGNVLASEDFTVNARATATITFDDATGESGGDTGVNIAFGESVSGLQLAHLSASSGTLSNLTGSGTSWEADLDFPATGMGTVTVTLAEDATIPQNAEATGSIDYAEPVEPLMLDWIVPTVPVDNTFPVTLTSNHELTGVVIADFRLRVSDNSEAVIILDATNATLTAVAGTNNWQIDISLTGTFDGDYTVRVRRNSLMFDGMNVPSPALASAAFAIDTSLGVDAVLAITLDATSVEQGEIVNATFTFDKAVGDFTAADVTISAGSKGALTDNGDNTYGMPITAPATGSGDVDVSVAADVVTPGNNSDTASFAYTEPVVALSFGSESIDNQAWEVGTAASVTLPEATGGVGTITYSLSPTLPSGKTFTAGTRVLDGNPTGRFSVETFTYTATDGNSDTVTLTFTAVVTAIAITIPNIPNQTWTVGTAVSVTLPEASGGVGAFTYSLSPTLPAGVSRTNRAVTGNPTAAVVVATYTYTAEDSEGITQTGTFTIVVTAAAVAIPSNLTGTGVQVGSAVEFGINFGGPSALASDGTTVFMFHLRRGYTVDPTTGIAVQIGGNNLGLSFNPRLSAAMYHNGEIIVHGTQNDELYSFDTTTYTLTAIGTGITIAGSNSSPVITGMTSLGGIIYVAEAFTDALMTLDESTSVLTPVDADTVGYGLDSPNIQSLAVYKGMLVAVNLDTTAADIRLVELSQTDGSATDFNNVVPPDSAITGMVEHNDQLLAAGNANDALYRMYDVLWDTTIDDLEVDEGDNATWDLSAISQDVSIYSLQNSPPSWLSITGADTNLVATSAPSVSADTNYDVTVRATRSGINIDEIIRVVVKNTVAPPANNAPVFGESSYTFSDVAIAVGTVVGTVAATDADNDTLTYSLTGTDTSTFAIDANGQITVDIALTNGQAYGFNVVADDGTDTASVGVSVTAIAAVIVDAVLDITADATSVEQGEVVNVTFTFDKAVGDFTAADVTISAGTKGALTDNGDNTYSMPITAPATGSGNVFVDVGTDVVTPGNNADTISFAYTEPAPVDAVLDITADATSVEQGEVVNVTFTFDKAVGGFDASDVTVTAGATKGVLTDNGDNTYSMPITAPATGSGNVYVDVGTDVVTPGNNADTISFAYTEPAPVITVPGAPTSLAATAETGGTSMALSWTAPANDGGDAVSDYEVRYEAGTSVSASVAWTALGQTTTTHTVSSLDKGTEYTFEVRAVNSQGGGAADSVTETTSTTLPGAPTSLMATADSNGTSMELDWTAPIDDGGSPITEYQYRYTTGTSTGGTWTDTDSTTTAFTISGLTVNTEYTFQVRTLTDVGNSQSNPSITETTADLSVPDAPTNLTATAQTGGRRVELDWDAPSDDGGDTITDYEVRYAEGTTIPNSTAWNSTGSTTTSDTVTGLDKGTQYTFEVRAVNSQGGGAADSVTETTLTTRPGAPTSLNVTTSGTSAVLSWIAPSDDGGVMITDYEVRYAEGNSATSGTWTSTASTMASTTISMLSSDTDYAFQVRAINSVGNGTASSTRTFTTSGISIEVIDDQIITIDTDYELDIDITGSPTEVTVDGLLEGFHYTWDGDTDIVTIIGDSSRLIDSATWTVNASKTGDSAISDIIYSVVPNTPIISGMSNQVVYKKSNIDIFIGIQNKPTQIQASSSILGLKFLPEEEGVRISGVIPGNTNFTIDEDAITINASNDSGSDTQSFMVTISTVEGLIALYMDSTPTTLYALLPDKTLAWTYEAPSGNYGDAVFINGAIYLFDEDNNKLLKINASGGLLDWTYNAPTGGYDPVVVTADSAYLFNENNDNLLKIDASDGTLDWTYNAPTGAYHSVVATADSVYLFDSSSDNLLKIDASDGTLDWTYDAPAATAGGYLGIVVTSDSIYLFDHTRDNLLKINVSDGTLDWTYDAPAATGIGGGYDPMVVTSDSVYLFDFSSDNLLKIDVSDGTLDWTYNAPTGDYDPMVVTSDSAYLFDEENDNLLKIDASDGTLDWTYNAPATTPFGGGYEPMVVTSDSVYLFDEQRNNLLKIDASDGSLDWTYDNAGLGDWASAIVVIAGAIYISNRTNSYLLKIDASDGSLDWTYNPPTSGAYDPFELL